MSSNIISQDIPSQNQMCRTLFGIAIKVGYTFQKMLDILATLFSSFYI